MSPWQVLRAGRRPWGYGVHHGPRPEYSTSVAALDGSRTFCLSREKKTLQQLNMRLAAYLQQIHSLEATNQRLEQQIQEELDKKCPRELKELDVHLRTSSLLQNQICECLSAQGQVKLQTLAAELTIFHFTTMLEKEREHRGRMEAELSDLRVLEEELKVHKLPELQNSLNNQTQQLEELQIQHLQNVQGLLTQISSGVAVEVQNMEALDLIQQLNDLRQASVMLLDENQNQNQCQSSLQVSVVSSPVVTFDHPEVNQEELMDLRRKAAILEDELTQLHTMNIELERFGLEHAESCDQLLVDLQHRADCLSRDLDSVLQASAHTAADHEVLLDVKNKLEAEIQDYKMLLDGLNNKGVSRLYCAPTSPAASRKHKLDRAVIVQGGNLRMMGVQTISRGHICSVRQTPVISTNQSVRVYSKYSESSPLGSTYTSNLSESFHNSEILTTGALSKKTKSEAIHVTKISQELDKGAPITASRIAINSNTESTRKADVQMNPGMFTFIETTKNSDSQPNEVRTYIQPEITNTITSAETEIKSQPHSVTQVSTSDLDKQTNVELISTTISSTKIDLFESRIQDKGLDVAQVTSLKLETPLEIVKDRGDVVLAQINESGSHCLTSEEGQGESSFTQTTKDAVSQPNEAETHSQTEIPSTITSAETEIKSKPHSVTQVSTSDLDKQTMSSTKMNLFESLGSHCLTSEGVQGESSDEVFLIDDKDAESQEQKEYKKNLKVEGDLVVLSADQNSALSMSNNHFEIETANTEILEITELELNKMEEVNIFHETGIEKVAPVELVHPVSEEALLSTTESKQSASLTDSGMALSSSDPEDPLCPTKTLSQEICKSSVKTEVLISKSELCMVDLKDHVEGPDSLLSPNDCGKNLSPNGLDACLSVVETTEILDTNGKEANEEECPGLTEGNAHVKTDEKYIVSTKEDQSSSFSGEVWPKEKDRNRVSSSDIISVKGDVSLCFGSFEVKEGIRSALTGHESDPQLNNSLGSQGGLTVKADKEKRLSFADMYQKSVQNVTAYEDGYKSSIAYNKDIQSTGGSQGRQHHTEDQKKTASMGSVTRNSGGVYAGKRDMVKDLAASSSDTAANSLDTVGNNAGNAATACRAGSGDLVDYGGKLGHGKMSVPRTGSEGDPSKNRDVMTRKAETETNSEEKQKFSGGGIGEWMVYGGSLRCNSSLNDTNLPTESSKGKIAVATDSATCPQERGRFGSRGSGEWMVYGSSLKRTRSADGSDNLTYTGSCFPATTNQATGPAEKGRFGSSGSGEWRVYGGTTGCVSTISNDSLPGTQSKEITSVATRQATSSPVEQGGGRFGGSGEWRVYGGSAGRLSRAGSTDGVNQVTSPPGSLTSQPRLNSAGSGGRLSSSCVVMRSKSVGSGGSLGSGNKISSSSGSHKITSSGRPASTGSGEWKPVNRMSVGSVGQSGVRMSSRQRAQSPGGRRSFSGGSGGWLNNSIAGGNRISSSGSGSKVSGPGSNDRISSHTGGRISSSTKGKVISSSNCPIRSTGSGVGSNKERISVCKMAALSISAAGRERSQERRKQRQEAGVATPLVQRWLTTSVRVSSTDPDGPDDNMRP